MRLVHMLCRFRTFSVFTMQSLLTDALPHGIQAEQRICCGTMVDVRGGCMRNSLYRLGAKLLLTLALFIAIMGVTTFTAHPTLASTMSNHCWYYEGGSTTTGGCVGNPYGGSEFQVYELCGWANWQESSPVKYAPPNRAVSATTSGCPWWSQGVNEAWVVSW